MCRADYSDVMFPSRPKRTLLVGLFVPLALLAGCQAEPERTYLLRGQILAIGGPPRPDGRPPIDQEVSRRHWRKEPGLMAFLRSL